MEKKVAWPTIVNAITAFLAILVTFNVPLTPEQTAAILGFVVTIGPILTGVVGWLTPHTKREDLYEYVEVERSARVEPRHAQSNHDEPYVPRRAKGR
jgi:hypothetical protein